MQKLSVLLLMLISLNSYSVEITRCDISYHESVSSNILDSRIDDIGNYSLGDCISHAMCLVDKDVNG